MPQTNKNSSNCFCYICGEITMKIKRVEVRRVNKRNLSALFCFSNRSKGKSCMPKLCFTCCSRTLRGWLEENYKSVLSAMPVIWTEPQNHENYCCLFMLSAQRYYKEPN